MIKQQTNKLRYGKLAFCRGEKVRLINETNPDLIGEIWYLDYPLIPYDDPMVVNYFVNWGQGEFGASITSHKLDEIELVR